MSEKIYLKVPSKPAADEVSHGNFHAKLEPGKVITVDNRRFADALIREHALAEVDKPKRQPSAVSGQRSARGSKKPSRVAAAEKTKEPTPKAGEETNGGNE